MGRWMLPVKFHTTFVCLAIFITKILEKNSCQWSFMKKTPYIKTQIVLLLAKLQVQKRNLGFCPCLFSLTCLLWDVKKIKLYGSKFSMLNKSVIWYLFIIQLILHIVKWYIKCSKIDSLNQIKWFCNTAEEM